MPLLAELRTLSIPERIQLVEDLWDTIAEDQQALPDSPAVIEEIRERKRRHEADPSAAVSWETAKARIRGQRG
ncbi:addiction module protein [Haloferula sp. BvORR071]|uniref:addiction module protein n=1 Tax=Haloferula sp. BvORR071 TaxID=1396141 RepID=UPI00054EEA21